MEDQKATPELLLREAELEARRRRVLRSAGAAAAVLAAGIALMLVAYQAAPGLLETAVVVFALATGVAMLAVYRTVRRHWRCPACDAPFERNDVLAAVNWNHCAHCGVALRAAPRRGGPEREALTRLSLESVPHDELVARFRRRRRRGNLAAGAAALAGVAAFVWVDSRGWSEMAQQAVVALVAGVVMTIVALSARCPRCRAGVIVGRARHCQRCGLELKRAPHESKREPRRDAGGDAAASRTER